MLPASVAPCVSDVWRAFEAVRRRGVEMDSRRTVLGEILDTEIERQQAAAGKWFTEQMAAYREGKK